MESATLPRLHQTSPKRERLDAQRGQLVRVDTFRMVEYQVGNRVVAD